MTNPKQSLIDLEKELQGTLLRDTFTVAGRQWEMRLLNAEETMWRDARIDMSSQFAALSSWKLPTLAIGIKSINGIPVEKYFENDWAKLDDDAKDVLQNANSLAKKYFVADHLMQYLSQLPQDFIKDLTAKWEELRERSSESQDTLKKSSGESLETEKTESI